MSVLIDLKEFFFPRFCVCCGKKLLLQEKTVCLSCLSDLPYTHIAGEPSNPLEKCFWGCFSVRRAAALFYYKKGGYVAQIVHAMKYHNHRSACIEMGKLMACELSKNDFFRDVDYILPVPLHPDRLRMRGYNQSELLARGISKIAGVPLMTDAVVRTFNNATQTRKSGYERWINARSLFASTPKAEILKGKHVLVVDDVLTTGATIVSFSDALSKVEGINISVATLAWAKE